MDANDFLKKIMISDNFDDFVDKIADKAVEKFHKLQNAGKHLQVTKYKGTDTVYRVSESDKVESNNNNDDDSMKIFNNISEENEKSENKNINKVNVIIDANAFQKKKSTFLKDLSLQFNRFTKSIDSDEPTTIGEDHNKEARKRATLKSVINKPDSDVPDDSENVKEAENKSHNSIINEDHNNSKEDSKADETNFTDNENIKEIVRDKSTELNTVKDQSTEVKSKQPTHDYLQLPVSEEENKISNKTTKDFVVVDDEMSKQNSKGVNKLEPMSDEDKTESNAKKYEDDSESSNSESGGSAHTTDLSVRKEGGKLYAHLNIPEYEDYNQEIKKMRSQYRKKIKNE